MYSLLWFLEKEATLGPYHSSTISSRFGLAAAYIEAGRIIEVDKLDLEKNLIYQVDMLVRVTTSNLTISAQLLQEEHLSPKHPTTVSSMVKLAALYLSMGRHEAALEMFQKCHRIRTETLGPGHELTIGMTANIATCLDALDKIEESVTAYTMVIEMASDQLGDADLLTLGQRYAVFFSSSNLADCNLFSAVSISDRH